MAQLNDEPDFSRILTGKYDCAAAIYVGTTGETITTFEKGKGIRFLIKEDNPYAIGVQDPSIKSLLFPILKLGITVHMDIWMKIIQHKNDLVVRLGMERIGERAVPDDPAIKSEVDQTILFDLRFEALLTATEGNATKILEESDEAQTDEVDKPVTFGDPKNVGDRMKSTVLILSVIDHRNRFKFPLNYSFTSSAGTKVTVAQALIASINTAIKEKGAVVMQMPTNTEKYDQIVIPPLNLKDAINFIHTVYGIYGGGLLVYQDLKYFYVLPKVSKKFSVPKLEFSIVDIYILGYDVSTKTPIGTLGYYIDNELQRYVVTSGPSFRFFDSEEINRETQGNKFIVINPEKAESALTYNSETWANGSDFVDEYEVGLNASNQGSGSKIRVFENSLSNDTLMTEKINMLGSTSKFIKLALNNTPMDLWTFNRTYKLHFLESTALDEKYGGEYRLLRVVNTAMSEQTEFMNASVDLTFAKIGELLD